MTGLFNLPLSSRLKDFRRIVIGAVSGVFVPIRNGFVLDRRELYNEAELGLLTKISFSALRRLTAACILRRKFLKRRTARKVVARIAARFKAVFAPKLRLAKFIKFLHQLYGGSAVSRFSSLVQQTSRSTVLVNSTRFDTLPLFLVKRYLLV